MCDKMKKDAEKYGFPYEKDGRVLVWHDEFDGNEIDKDKWSFSRTMNSPDREYDNSEKYARVEDGNLHMQVWRSEIEGLNYALSEGITTRNNMLFKYGRVEMRARVPYRHGAWPSFWMQSCTPFAKASYMAEIDIFEIFSNPNTVEVTIHKWGGGQHVALPRKGWMYDNLYKFENFENLNDEYHIYAFEWDKNFTRFYVDDTCFATFPIDEEHNFGGDIHPGMAGFHDPAFLIMNNEIFSPGSKFQPEGSVLNEQDEMPIDYYIDYIRVYQNPQTDEIYFTDEIAAKAAEQQDNK